MVAFYSYFYEAKTPPLGTTILLALFGVYLIIISSGDGGQGRFAKILRITIIVLSVLVVVKTFFFG